MKSFGQVNDNIVETRLNFVKMIFPSENMIISSIFLLTMQQGMNIVENDESFLVGVCTRIWNQKIFENLKLRSDGI